MALLLQEVARSSCEGRDEVLEEARQGEHIMSREVGAAALIYSGSVDHNTHSMST
jgi:hypothetical protein